MLGRSETWLLQSPTAMCLISVLFVSGGKFDGGGMGVQVLLSCSSLKWPGVLSKHCTSPKYLTHTVRLLWPCNSIIGTTKQDAVWEHSGKTHNCSFHLFFMGEVFLVPPISSRSCWKRRPQGKSCLINVERGKVFKIYSSHKRIRSWFIWGTALSPLSQD